MASGREKLRVELKVPMRGTGRCEAFIRNNFRHAPGRKEKKNMVNFLSAVLP